jgi:hypothetical protein
MVRYSGFVVFNFSMGLPAIELLRDVLNFKVV